MKAMKKIVFTSVVGTWIVCGGIIVDCWLSPEALVSRRALALWAATAGLWALGALLWYLCCEKYRSMLIYRIK